MGDIPLGTLDRGYTDPTDPINVRNNALKSKLTAKQAEDFARANPGAEIVVQDTDGSYSVHELTTTDSDHELNNNDFKKDYAVLDQNKINSFTGGKKAYIVTTDNLIRTLDTRGINLPSIDQEFVNAKLLLSLEDKDGIDTKSKKDLSGTISGNISISREFIAQVLAEASKANSDVNLKLRVDPENQQYNIKVTSKGGTGLATLTLKMGQGDMTATLDTAGKVKFAQGLLNAGIAMSNADSMGFTPPTPMIDFEKQAVDDIIKQISDKMDLKIDRVSDNQIKLTPDFKNSKLLGQINAGDMRINLDSVKANPGNTTFKLTDRGDLQIVLKQAEITGSSDPNSKTTAVPDKEGSDKITVDVSGTVKNDLSAKVKTKTGAKVSITENEKKELGERFGAVKKLNEMGS